MHSCMDGAHNHNLLVVVLNMNQNFNIPIIYFLHDFLFVYFLLINYFIMGVFYLRSYHHMMFSQQQKYKSMSELPITSQKNSQKKSKTMSKFFFNNKQYKEQIRMSFQSKFGDNPEFDAYINSQFTKMTQEKNENPTLIIPRGFLKFVQSKSFKELLKRTYVYLEALTEFQNKYGALIKHQQDTNNVIDDPLFKMLRYETDVLEGKCKQIGYAYMGILLGYGDNKLVFKDQYFFETMIYFLTKVLRQNFEASQYNKIEEQLNRIFRTNTFNLIKRRHQEDQMYQKFPILKQSKYDGSPSAIVKLQSRLNLQKKNNYSMQIKGFKDKSITKPINIPLSTFHSIKSRSPLIASFYPSQKEKLYNFSKQVRQKQSFFKGNPQNVNESVIMEPKTERTQRGRDRYRIKQHREKQGLRNQYSVDLRNRLQQ